MTDQIGIASQLKAHAHRNYEKDGWDILIECYSDDEIVKAIGNATTLRGAIYKVRKSFFLKEKASNRAEIEATAF